MPDANSLIKAQLDVEVNAGAVALVWSAAPQANATIVTLTAILGTMENGVLQTQFCAAEYPVPGTRGGALNGTLSGTAACFVPAPTLQTVAVLTGQVEGAGGGMFFFTQPFHL